MVDLCGWILDGGSVLVVSVDIEILGGRSVWLDSSVGFVWLCKWIGGQCVVDLCGWILGGGSEWLCRWIYRNWVVDLCGCVSG